MTNNRKKLTSEKFRYEIAQELGFSDKIKSGGWESLSAKEAGMIVRKMIEKGENSL